MTATAYIYRALWEVEHPELPLKRLIAEARADLDVMAAGDGARIVGDPTWTTSGDKLICEAPAEPVPPPAANPVDEAKVIRACRGERIQLNRREILAAIAKLQRENPEMTHRDIANRLRRSVSNVRQILAIGRQAAAHG